MTTIIEMFDSQLSENSKNRNIIFEKRPFLPKVKPGTKKKIWKCFGKFSFFEQIRHILLLRRISKMMRAVERPRKRSADKQRRLWNCFVNIGLGARPLTFLLRIITQHSRYELHTCRPLRISCSSFSCVVPEMQANHRKKPLVKMQNYLLFGMGE